MKAKDKKQIIFDATSEVIKRDGIVNLTLDRVCDEANISRGGLLYHFPSKEDLILKLSDHILDEFQEEINTHLKTSKTFTEAYLRTSLESLEGEGIQVFSALIGYQTEEWKLFQGWNDFYTNIKERLKTESNNEIVSLVILISDGLWFRKTFNFSGVEKEEAINVINYILDLVNQEDL